MNDQGMQTRYGSALTVDAFVAKAKTNCELWESYARRATADTELVARVNRLTSQRFLLVLLEDWCGDAVNTIPALAALASASETLDLRMLERGPEALAA